MSPDKPKRHIGESELQYLSRRVDWLGDRFDGLNDSLVHLASARLLQQAFTGIVLGALFTAIIKVLGG